LVASKRCADAAPATTRWGKEILEEEEAAAAAKEEESAAAAKEEEEKEEEEKEEACMAGVRLAGCSSSAEVVSLLGLILFHLRKGEQKLY
jgi:hypothetical protein